MSEPKLAVVPKVFAAISAISAELATVGIAKTRSNKDQGYKFRGIDDVYNVLAPLLSKNRLVILPQVLERTERETQSKSGGKLNYVVLKVQYSFVHTEDCSTFNVVSIGEGMDSSDKATNKAFSAAHKYALLQAFAIPVEGTPDADENSPATADPDPGMTVEQAEELGMRVKAAGLSVPKLVKYFEVQCLAELNLTQVADLDKLIKEKEAKRANS